MLPARNARERAMAATVGHQPTIWYNDHDLLCIVAAITCSALIDLVQPSFEVNMNNENKIALPYNHTNTAARTLLTPAPHSLRMRVGQSQARPSRLSDLVLLSAYPPDTGSLWFFKSYSIFDLSRSELNLISGEVKKTNSTKLKTLKDRNNLPYASRWSLIFHISCQLQLL